MANEKNLFQTIGKFFREVKVELQKVNWPNMSEVMSYTTVVIVVVLAIAFFIGGIDLVFSRLIKPIILN